MRAQNRNKLMAAIVLLAIAGFLSLRMSRQQRSAPTALAEQLTEVPSAQVHLPRASPVGRSKNPAPSLSAPVQDPTLRLELLMALVAETNDDYLNASARPDMSGTMKCSRLSAAAKGGPVEEGSIGAGTKASRAASALPRASYRRPSADSRSGCVCRPTTTVS